MGVFLLILAIILLLVGLVGCVFPVVPGPPIAWVGLFLIKLSEFGSFSNQFLIWTAIITLILTLLDFIIPSLSTKRFGGSKAAQRGAMIGTIVGVFAGPWGILAGPFVGAFLGEYIVNPKDISKVLKIATGSFIGFLLSTGIKLIWCMMLLWWGLKAVIVG